MAGSDTDGINSRLMTQARFLRRFLRRSRQRIHYGKAALNNSPVLFANSFPKSGTHLLTQVLSGFTHLGPAVESGLPAVVTFRGDTGSQREETNILEDIGRLLPGDIAYGHLHATPAIVASFLRDGMAAYFILRDPRDVAVSHVHYLTEMAPRHIHHRYFSQELGDFNARLFASITGVSSEQLARASPQPGDNSTLPLPDIHSRFAPYLAWLGHSEILTLRFEEFLDNLMETIGRVLDHAVNRRFQLQWPRYQAIDKISQAIDPSRSPTFRSGKAGAWRDVFSDDHKRAFKQVAGDLLVQLGYENDYSW